jgi:predicted  nucleic acid-binding Zn-ribbon protein
MQVLLGCDHCGNVVRGIRANDGAGCPDCGRSLREIGPEEAKGLTLERRVAAQFRRTARLQLPGDVARIRV